MDGYSTSERELLMQQIMTSNNLLHQMRKHVKIPDGRDAFTRLMPHLSEILDELASYIFFAPPSAVVNASNIVEYLSLQQEQTLDIWRFEAYSYLIAHLS